MSEARNSAVNFPKFRKRKLTDPLPRPHTALVGGRQPAQRAKPVKSRLLSDKPPATVLKAPHNHCFTTLNLDGVISVVWVSYLGHRDLVSISPQVTQHLGSQNSLLLVAHSSGRDWMSPEDLPWKQARIHAGLKTWMDSSLQQDWQGPHQDAWVSHRPDLTPFNSAYTLQEALTSR